MNKQPFSFFLGNLVFFCRLSYFFLVLLSFFSSLYSQMAANFGIITDNVSLLSSHPHCTLRVQVDSVPISLFFYILPYTNFLSFSLSKFYLYPVLTIMLNVTDPRLDSSLAISVDSLTYRFEFSVNICILLRVTVILLPCVGIITTRKHSTYLNTIY